MIDAVGNLIGATTKLVVSLVLQGALILAGIAALGIVSYGVEQTFLLGWNLLG